jgi:putative oxidoreductase
MLAKILDRFSGLGLTLLRIVTGLIFLLHGLPKLNLEGTAGFFGSVGVPLPQLMAIVILLIEVVGGALLIAGVATRLVSLLLVANMAVAIALVRLQAGFIGGYEFELLLMTAAFALAVTGGGAYSVEKLVLKREVI